MREIKSFSLEGNKVIGGKTGHWIWWEFPNIYVGGRGSGGPGYLLYSVDDGFIGLLKDDYLRKNLLKMLEEVSEKLRLLPKGKLSLTTIDKLLKNNTDTQKVRNVPRIQKGEQVASPTPLSPISTTFLLFSCE